MNCGFQHQGGATCTTAPAVLETELQFPLTHPDSSFLDAFLAKRIPFLSTGLGTPWVQLIFSTPKNKRGERNTNPFKSNLKRKKEGFVRGNNPKRNEGFQALFELSGFQIRLPHSNGEHRGGYQRKPIGTNWDCRGNGMQRRSPCDPAGPFPSFKKSFETGKRNVTETPPDYIAASPPFGRWKSSDLQRII